VRLTGRECAARLAAADHGILCTVNASGDVDAVPVCFVVVGTHLATPIERVKPKRTTELARVRNLDRRPGATLLCEHWDAEDWSVLWWVRARLQRLDSRELTVPQLVDCEAALRAKYRQYETADFAAVIVFAVVQTMGWSASAPPSSARRH